VQFFAQDQVYDCEGPITYDWDFGDGTRAEGETVTHTYRDTGSYTWTLTLASAGKTSTSTGTIEVAEPCSLTCSATADPSQGNAPVAVGFEAAATASHCDQEPTFFWEFGDGSTSSEPNPTHEYGERGTYAWTLTVEVEGLICTQQGTVEVWPAIPGDCDDSGTVSIGEVQTGINMFLGSQPASCGVDVNGDTVVSIGEVQQVINEFLG
jgi:PKD repeat protein